MKREEEERGEEIRMRARRPQVTEQNPRRKER